MKQGHIFQIETKEVRIKFKNEVKEAKALYKRFYPLNYRQITKIFISEYLKGT